MMKVGLLALGCVLAASSAHAQVGVGIGTGIGVSSSRAQSIGVGNAFGAQSLMNSINSVNSNSARQGQAQAVNIFNPPSNQGTNAGATNTANRSVTTTNSGNTIVKNPGFAPSVYAPSVGGASPCDSYISLGGSAIGGGGSFAFPWQNHNCDMRANSLMLKELGMMGAARARMCYDDDTAAAMMSMGYRCPVGKYAPRPQQTAYVATVGAAPLPPVNGDFFYDKQGRRYRSVPCAPGHKLHAASGECLTRN